jgi:hypothetical protein
VYAAVFGASSNARPRPQRRNKRGHAAEPAVLVPSVCLGHFARLKVDQLQLAVERRLQHELTCRAQAQQRILPHISKQLHTLLSCMQQQRRQYMQPTDSQLNY